METHQRCTDESFCLEDSFIAGESRPIIPEGEYEAECIGVKKIYYRERGREYPKLELTFMIDVGEYAGTELPLYINLAGDSQQQTKKLSPASKYYQSWVTANYGIPPKRGDRMPVKVFKGIGYRVLVRQTTPRYCGDDTRMKYSIIDHLIDRQA